MHGGGIDLRGHVHELDLEHARREADLADVLHQAEVAVVDRHHDVRLGLAGDAEGRRSGVPGEDRQTEQGEDHPSRLHRSVLLSLQASGASAR
ncbi:MAG: hypothetical protein A2X50_16770 [Candidatus Rokubacteria bacterium GWF2_70_14]|nr:MAG: hypothetical protein A2X50_16770 [Candidatus Rokubacteria bacterium GWF2_70_14]